MNLPMNTPVSTPYNNITANYIIDKNQESENINKTDNKKTRLSIFYINDVHGQMPRMEQLTSASLAHDVFVKSNNIDGLKLSSGDILLGSNKNVNKTAVSFLNLNNINASTLGNHEFDDNASNLADHIKNSTTKFLGMNLNFPENNKHKLNNKIVKSTIEEVNGNKYGIIGIQPSSLSARVKNNSKLEGITVDDDEQTIKELQEEVSSLEKKGINKIILLSHSGKEMDQKIAKNVEGIDVILGGHSHDLIQGIKENENLFISKRNEPIIITQAGRDGKNFGVLDIVFDNNGKIINAKNEVKDTNNYPKNIIMQFIGNKFFGNPNVIGNISYIDKFPNNPLIEENPFASFIADAMKNELDCDIALINSGNLRGAFTEGEITSRDISSIVPFNNKVMTAYVSEKDLVDALSYFAKSVNQEDNKPGLLQVSGLKYTISDKGDLKKLYFISKDGKKHKIDINNPSETKKYKVAMDDYVGSANECPDCIKKLNTPEMIKLYPFDKDKLAIDYMKKFNNTPIEIKYDKRIKVKKDNDD